MFTTFQIGEKLLPDKFATEDELRRLISRYSTNGRATTAADLGARQVGGMEIFDAVGRPRCRRQFRLREHRLLSVGGRLPRSRKRVEDCR